jgi:hypothetical protein
MTMLFNVSPDERDGQKKKAKRRSKPADQQRTDAESLPPLRNIIAEIPDGFLSELDGQAPCPRCGETLTDLIRVEMKRGELQWLVQCGWGCHLFYWVDPIPGISIMGEKETKRNKGEFRVQVGEWTGMTLDEIDGEGGRWAIEAFAEGLSDQRVQKEAIDWLKKNA